MEILNFYNEHNVVIFVLLLTRLSALFLFFPFYSHAQIPVVIKSSLVLIFTFYFFPLAYSNEASYNNLIFAILSEFLMGFIVGLCLQLSFTILQMAGEHMSFIMGFSMASVLDPSTGTQTPIIGQVISFLALLLFLAYDGHHLCLILISKSINSIDLGAFYLDDKWYLYIMQRVKDIYLIGLSLAFPIVAMSVLCDFVFGLLMKTMPQFNLLVVGYPIKITISFTILIVILGTILYYFKELVLKNFYYLDLLVNKV